MVLFSLQLQRDRLHYDQKMLANIIHVRELINHIFIHTQEAERQRTGNEAVLVNPQSLSPVKYFLQKGSCPQGLQSFQTSKQHHQCGNMVLNHNPVWDISHLKHTFISKTKN